MIISNIYDQPYSDNLCGMLKIFLYNEALVITEVIRGT